MGKKQLRKFREHYFPEKTITKSRALLSKQFGITERCARSWESGDPIQPWFIKSANEFDEDEILKEGYNE